MRFSEAAKLLQGRACAEGGAAVAISIAAGVLTL